MSYESCIASSSSKRETQSQLMAILFSCGQDSSVNPSKVQIWAPQWVPNAPKTIQKSPKKNYAFWAANYAFWAGNYAVSKIGKSENIFCKFNIPKTQGAFGDPKPVEVHNTPCHSTGRCKYFDFFKYWITGPNSASLQVPPALDAKAWCKGAASSTLDGNAGGISLVTGTQIYSGGLKGIRISI